MEKCKNCGTKLPVEFTKEEINNLNQIIQTWCKYHNCSNPLFEIGSGGIDFDGSLLNESITIEIEKNDD